MLNLIIAEDLTKTYRTGTIAVDALKGLDFTIPTGAFVSFVGPSGSGKTTLLNLVGCLDKPSSGRLLVAGMEVGSLNGTDAALFRGKHIGFIFQSFNLIPVLTVFENVEYPLVMVQNVPAGRRREAVEELLWELRGQYTILIVTHNMAQARRASEECIFMLMGKVVEHARTEEMFVTPTHRETADYIEGRYG